MRVIFYYVRNILGGINLFLYNLVLSKYLLCLFYEELYRGIYDVRGVV